MQERLERIERRQNLADTAIDTFKKALSSLDKRVFSIERHVFGPGFWGSAFGSSLVIGGYLAWKHITGGQ